MSSVAKKALFATIPVLLLVVGAEVVVRMSWQPPDLGTKAQGTFMVPHDTRIWTLPEGEHRAHGASFRADDEGLRTSPSTNAPYTVLTTGDSSIFGHALEDEHTLHAWLVKELLMQGMPVEAHTLGVPGYSSEQTRVVLDEVGWNMEPDLLIIGNLWSDNDLRFFSDRTSITQLAEGKPTAQRIEDNLALLQLARWTFAPPAEETLPVGWVRDPYATGRRRVSLSEYAENIDWMVTTAASHGTSVLFLSPCNEVLIDASWTQPTVWDPYFETMARVAEYRDVPLVEACAVLQAHSLTKDQAFLDSMHPNADTNRLYARAIARTLHKLGWPATPLLGDSSKPPFDDPAPENWDMETDWLIGEEPPPEHQARSNIDGGMEQPPGENDPRKQGESK